MKINAYKNTLKIFSVSIEIGDKTCCVSSRDAFKLYKDLGKIIGDVEQNPSANVCSPARSSGESAGLQDGDWFLSGYLAALQFLVIGYGMDSIAEEAMRESGYKVDEFIAIQKKTGFKTRKMNKIIRNAFGVES